MSLRGNTMKTKENTTFDKIKSGIKREWKRTKEERNEYLKNSKGSIIKKVPNTLTEIRIVMSLILPFVALSNPVSAIVMASLVALTDFMDGFIARKCNAQSKYGALLDTIGDKLLSVSLVCALAPTFPIQAGLILLSEALIVGTNTYARISGKETKSSMLGKVKTWFLSVSTISGMIAMIAPSIMETAEIALSLAIAFQAATIVDYQVRYNKVPTVKKEELKKIESSNNEMEEPKTVQKSYEKTSQYWKQEKDRLLNETKEETKKKQR